MFVFSHVVGDRQRKLFEVSQIAGSHRRRANILNGRDKHGAKRGNNRRCHDNDTPAFTD
jgi:hypothetical protein